MISIYFKNVDRRSEFLDPIRVLFCRLRVRACIRQCLFTFYSHVFFFVSYYYYWTSVLSWLVGFYSSINFSFWYLLLRYIHSERSFSLAWAIIKVNTYFTIVVLKRCVSIALPHIKSCHMQLWEIESDRASERTTEEERAGRVKTSLYQTTTVCNVMSDVN